MLEALTGGTDDDIIYPNALIPRPAPWARAC